MMPIAATSGVTMSSNAPGLTTPPPVEKNTRIVAAPRLDAQKNERNTHNLSTDWIWPANGKILSHFLKKF